MTASCNDISGLLTTLLSEKRPRAGTALQPMTKRSRKISSTLAEPSNKTTRTRPRQRSNLESAHSPNEWERSDHDPEAGEPLPRGLVAPLEEMYFQPEAESAICVQSFDDSLNSAIRTTYRISLRSSSLFMPRYPSTRVVYL